MLFRRAGDAAHDVENMAGQFAGATVGASRLNACRHVRQADAAHVVVVDENPVLLDDPSVRDARLAEADIARKLVWIREMQRALRAVQFNVVQIAVLPDVETCRQIDDGAAGEFENRRDVRIDFDRKTLSCVHAAADTRVRRTGGHADDAFHRAKQIDERRDVVRPHVEQRAAAMLVVEAGRGMPMLMAVVQHEGVACDDASDHPVVQQHASELMAAAHERVRSATDMQSFPFRRLHDLQAGCQIQPERFFGIDVLAVFQGTQLNVRVGLGRCQIQDDVDVWIGEKIVQRHGLDSELVRLRLGTFGMAVRAFRDLQMLKGASILQIGRADVTAADDSRFHESLLLAWQAIQHQQGQPAKDWNQYQ